MRPISLLTLTVLILIGCAGGGTAPSASPAASPTQAAPTSTAPTIAPTSMVTPAPTAQPTEAFQVPDLTGEVPQELLLQMLEQVSAATGVAIPEIVVERAQAVTWSDGSLGCPEPGMMYTQALVDGFWVVVEAGGETYDIHASQSGHFVVCPPERSKPPIEP